MSTKQESDAAFAERLMGMRIERGLSQRALCARAGLPEKTVPELELGRSGSSSSGHPSPPRSIWNHGRVPCASSTKALLVCSITSIQYRVSFCVHSRRSLWPLPALCPGRAQYACPHKQARVVRLLGSEETTP